jgi:predicted transglutaminase-like cysteine proteinase
MSPTISRCLAAVASLSLLPSAPPAGAQDVPRCMALTIPVAYLDEAPGPYLEFCEKNDGACTLTGPAIVDWSPELHERLRDTNARVNGSVAFVPDRENSGLDEVWEFPRDGKGDCEDFALEKRRQLVAAGLPSASLTCAIAFHQVQLFPHAVLLVETTAGTFVLDHLYDEVLCWDAVPYFYAAREGPDGQWIRFQQP